MKKLLKPLSFIPALLLMCMIFNFSSQTGDVSSQLSHKASIKIVEAGDYLFSADLEPWQIEEWAGKINFITRKLAHMAEYFLLAVAVSFPLYVYGLHGIGLMLVAGIICVGFAAGDEYHQSFVAGRGPSLKDVGIDSIGVFFGIIFTRIIGWSGRMTLFRPKKKKIKKVKVKNKVKYQQPDYSENTYNTSYKNEYDYRTPKRNPAASQNPNNHGPFRQPVPPDQHHGYYNSPQNRQDCGHPPYQPNYQYPPYPQNFPPGSNSDFYGGAPEPTRYQNPPYPWDSSWQDDSDYYYDDEYTDMAYDKKPHKTRSQYKPDDYDDLEFFPLSSFFKKAKAKPKSK